MKPRINDKTNYPVKERDSRIPSHTLLKGACCSPSIKKQVTTPSTEASSFYSSDDTVKRDRTENISTRDFIRPISSSHSSILSVSTLDSTQLLPQLEDGIANNPIESMKTSLSLVSCSSLPSISNEKKVAHSVGSLKLPRCGEECPSQYFKEQPTTVLQNTAQVYTKAKTGGCNVARRKYPLTVENFTESGKLALLQKRLVERFQKFNGEIGEKKFTNSSLSGEHRKPMWVDSVEGRSTENITFDVTESKHNSSFGGLNSTVVNQEKEGGDATTSIQGLPCTDNEEFKQIELIFCDKCNKSFSREVYERRCKVGKCNIGNTKRKVFSSARVRIMSNEYLSEREKSSVSESRRNIIAEKKRCGGTFKKSSSYNKWKNQSNELRDAMKANRLIAKAKKEGKPLHYYL